MIRCRETAPADLDAIADFLTCGRPRNYYAPMLKDRATPRTRHLPQHQPDSRKCFKGPQYLRAADLSDTELVIYAP
jgi:hypothetical protein